ncbi:MAG: protein kinase [Acidobacteria bacterium]|nr:protein kinase [Acidobacteriota bacterium]MBI3423288.1 protein kinase [Acidobacteriota bacterium]
MLRLEPGQIFSHYRIIEQLGQGGQATAYKAEDLRLQRLVVIKTLLPELAATDTARRRFEREARLASALDHPNICAIFDIGETDGLYYIVMPFIAGPTLKQVIHQNGTQAGGQAHAGQPLAINSALSIALQIADALSAAHARGIVHRDIKPSNIIVNEQGQVKVLDFGLAKMIDGDEAGSNSLHDKSMTEMGVPYGTMGYGSPEQATGERVDHRTDVFSLGVLLYEMITGQQPFTGRNRIEIFHAVINAVPCPMRELQPGAPPVLQAQMQAMLDRALAKEPAERYATMVELREELKTLLRELAPNASISPTPVPLPPQRARGSAWRLSDAVGRVFSGGLFNRPGRGRGADSKAPQRAQRSDTGQPSKDPSGSASAAITLPMPARPAAARPVNWGTETKPTVAVLPFKNLSGNPEDSFYEFALADGLITELAHVHSLVVRPSSYIAQYVGHTVDPRQVGEELAASVVLTGSFLRTPDRFRFNAQLIATANGELRWSDKIDIPVRDMLTMQDELAERVIAGLKLKLTEEEQEKIDRPLTNNPQAYEYYLRGRDLLFKYTARTFDDSELDLAIGMFEQAVKLDPHFARAHAALGRCYVHHAQGYGGEHYYDLAERSLQRALALEPELPSASLQMVYVLLHRGEKEKALSLLADVRRDKPNDPAVFIIAGMLYRLNGQYDKALKQYDRLLELNPKDIVWASYNRGRIYSYQGRYEEALAELERGRKVEPEHPLIKTFSASVLLNQGRVDEARALAEETLHQHPHFEALHVFIARCLSVKGHHAEARALITEQVKATAAADHDIAFWLASFYALEDLRDEAIEWLQRAIKLGNENYPYFAQNKKLDRLRDDPRFIALMNELKARWEERN